MAAPAPVLEFWFDFASTFSYPAAMRIGTLAGRAGIAIAHRPFPLGPIFKAQGWTTSPFNLFAAKGRNMWRDLERTCSGMALPFERPDPFPQSSLLAARLALVGLADRWGEDVCRTVFWAEFAQRRRIDDPKTLGAILEDLKVEPVAALAAAGSEEIKEKLRAQTNQAQQIGIFGAPSFRTADGELFWGNDRLESALEWALQWANAAH
jgi:2-hydroxychromene-2-carboxylate isomerase